MSYPIPHRFANIAVHAGPSPLGAWFLAAWHRLTATPPKTPPARDRAREAAEVRAWATQVRATDPSFADDLYAAADRHEREGG